EGIKMDSIKVYVLNICIVSVLTAVFRILIPNGNIKKSAEIVMSLLLLSIILIPLLSMKNPTFSNSISLNTTAKTNEEIFSDINTNNQAIRKAIDNELLNSGIKAENIEVKTHKDEQNYIIIESVMINRPSEQDDNLIKTLIKTKIGIDEETIKIVR
ncbi:MAG: stage III sporulation protein AF, partial [Oscillospiraceae bacterium]